MALTAVPLGLPGQVFRCPMPFSGYDRAGSGLAAMRAAGVSVIVVLTEPDETRLHAGCDLLALYGEAGLEVIQFPIRDLGIAADDAFRRLVANVLDHLHAGRHVAIHCLAGKGRTGTLLACLARAVFGYGPDEAIAWVRRHVPGAVESPAQLALVARLEGRRDEATRGRRPSA